jgi:hypothetical protein
VKLERNHLLLAAALAVTLILVVLAPNEPDDAVVGSAKKASRSRGAVAAGPQSLAVTPAAAPGLAGQPDAIDAGIKDLFRSATWYQPPPPPVVAPVVETPPEKIVPPLPFTYLGTFREGDTTLYILERDNQILTVAPGDVVDDAYLFNLLDEHSLSVTYLPLDAVQVLETGPSL